MPKRVVAWAFFNRDLIQSYPMSVKRAVEKARATDWKDQLQEALREKTHAPAPALPAVEEASLCRSLRR